MTIAALMALFNIQNNPTCWLRESRSLSDDNGAFPQLESYRVNEIEVSQSQRKIRNTNRNLYESSDEESSDDFMQIAYRAAFKGSTCDLLFGAQGVGAFVRRRLKLFV